MAKNQGVKVVLTVGGGYRGCVVNTQYIGKPSVSQKAVGAFLSPGT